MPRTVLNRPKDLLGFPGRPTRPIYDLPTALEEGQLLAGSARPPPRGRFGCRARGKGAGGLSPTTLQRLLGRHELGELGTRPPGLGLYRLKPARAASAIFLWQLNYQSLEENVMPMRCWH